MRRLIFLLAMTISAGMAFAQQPPPPNPADGPLVDDPRDVIPREVTKPGPITARSTVVVEGKATREQVLKAIAAFRRDPLAAKADGAGAVILGFAEQSAEVQVEMGPHVLPWMDEEGSKKFGDVLLAAFVAGNVQAQLDAHHAKDDAMAGALQVINTYQQLRKKDPTVRSAAVERWIVLQSQGKLRAELEKVTPAAE